MINAFKCCKLLYLNQIGKCYKQSVLFMSVFQTQFCGSSICDNKFDIKDR